MYVTVIVLHHTLPEPFLSCSVPELELKSKRKIILLTSMVITTYFVVKSMTRVLWEMLEKAGIIKLNFSKSSGTQQILSHCHWFYHLVLMV
jgi:hypothetical protein